MIISMILQIGLDNYVLWLGGTMLLVIAAFAKSFAVVTEDPPHRAVYVFARARTETEFNEGLVFIVPLLEKLIPVNVVKRDYDAKHVVRTRDNAELTVRVQIAWNPDPDRLKRFLQVGKVQKLLDGLVEETLRDFFYNKVAPEELQEERRKKKYEVRRKLLGDLTGKEQELLAVEMAKPENQRAITSDGVYAHFIVWQLEIQQPWESALAIEKQLKDTLLRALTDNGVEAFNVDTGAPDNQSWGIRILNVFPGEIKPVGRTADAADKKAQEVAERRAETFETETETQQAVILMQEADKVRQPISFEEALRRVQDYKATREGHGFALPGVASSFIEIARIIARQMVKRGE